MSIPRPPSDLKRAGRALWTDVQEQFEGWTPAETSLLHQACLIADRLVHLNSLVGSEGPIIKAKNGEQRAHPALVELRMQQVTQARLFASMRMPDAEGMRPQHRQVRGTHQGRRLRGVG